jgi:hypothetical protein
VREGYAPELEDPDPAVIMFTTGIAARATGEFVHMLTGFNHIGCSLGSLLSSEGQALREHRAELRRLRRKPCDPVSGVRGRPTE